MLTLIWTRAITRKVKLKHWGTGIKILEQFWDFHMTPLHARNLQMLFHAIYETYENPKVNEMHYQHVKLRWRQPSPTVKTCGAWR